MSRERKILVRGSRQAPHTSLASKFNKPAHKHQA